MTAADATPEPWSRRRLLATMLAVAAVAAVLLGALGYGTYSALTGHDTPSTAAVDAAQVSAGDVATGLSGQARRDAIAAAPMRASPPTAAWGGASGTAPPPTVVVPPATTVGPAQVPTGFPRTPEGALGQWGAIASTVLAHMSLEVTDAVHHAWASPGAAPVRQWRPAVDVVAFRSGPAAQYVDDATTVITAVPVAGQVKGVDGPDWALTCVLVKVTARVVTEDSVVDGMCARMEWTGDRWVIAPGTEPARAPATWPGTQLALEAGWRTWVADAGEPS